MKKRVLSLMLATVMCMALAVTANAVEYDSSISRYYGTGNCSYTAYSALYADGGSRYRAATWVETMNGGNVAAGNMIVVEYDRQDGSKVQTYSRDRKSTRLNSSHTTRSRMPSSA